MSHESFPILVCDDAEADDRYATIKINKKKFTIGRSLTNDFTLPIISVSRYHCTLELKRCWTISDHSSSGTAVNGLIIKKGEKVELNFDDKISFGGKTFSFVYWQKDAPPHKKRKLKTVNDAKEDSHFGEKALKEEIERLEAKHAAEKAALEAELQAEALKQEKLTKDKEQMEEILSKEKKNTEALLEKENRLASKLQEMEQKLTEQESAHEEIKQKLIDKEQQRIRDLKILQEKQEAETKAALEELKTKLTEKENTLRSTLQDNMSSLQSERNILEESIKIELKKEDDSNKNLSKLKEELDRVKKELESVEGKKILLETELQNVNSTNKVSSENELRAKEDILTNFGTLMESELQCSICNELFVRANTLNCTHTFCQFCIGEWRKKKNECPVCRAIISSQNRSIALDNFIDKMVENLTQDMKNRRQEIVEERAVHEIMDKPKTPKKTTSNRPRRSVRTGNDGRRSAGASTSNTSVVVISDDSSNSDSDSTSDSCSSTSSDSDEDSEWTEMDDYEGFEFDSASDRPRIAGIRGAYYGGYGHCFKCGAVGHWANGCPSRF